MVFKEIREINEFKDTTLNSLLSFHLFVDLIAAANL